MDIQEAKRKLEVARKKQRDLRKYIDHLRDTLRQAGEDPDAPKIDLTDRNKQFYIKWKGGMKFSEISKEFKLSLTTISSVCHRIDKSLESERHPRYKKYKSLLRYKNGIKKAQPVKISAGVLTGISRTSEG